MTHMIDGLPSVEAIVEAIAALPEPARRRLIAKMRQRGYLEPENQNPSRPSPSPPPQEPSPAATVVTRGTTTTTQNYQLQFWDGPDNLLCAQVTEWEGCKSFGRDRLEAVQNLICLIGAQTANGDLVALQPAVEGPEACKFATQQKLRNHQQILLYLESVRHQLSATTAADD